MAGDFTHSWKVTPAEAIALQRSLAGRVITRDAAGTVRTIAGVDAGFEDNGQITRAAVCVFDAETREPVDSAVHRLPTAFPYIPGLLSFRELPAVLGALEKLRDVPDLLLCDGQGRAHPRRLGIAAHLGVLIDRPTVGVGKTRLFGSHGPVPAQRGGTAVLSDGDEVLGAVVRTRENVKPVYVSPGHRLSVETAVSWVMRTVTRYKLPDPIRAADRLASRKS